MHCTRYDKRPFRCPNCYRLESPSSKLTPLRMVDSVRGFRHMTGWPCLILKTVSIVFLSDTDSAYEIYYFFIQS